MTSRILPLLALFLLGSCAAHDDMMSKQGATAPALEAVVIDAAPEPAVANRDAPLEECSGDGIGGTGCPDI